MVTGLFTSLMVGGNAAAQTLVTPNGTGTRLFNDPSMPLGVNTAMIDYSSMGYPPMYAYASYSSFSGGYFDVYDPFLASFASGLSPTALGATPTGTPDIIIGNTGGMTSGTDFIVAVAYPVSGSGIEVDFYRIYDDGININVTATYTPVTYSCNAATVHINVIAEHANTTATNMPFCDKFILTWDDLTTNLVYAANGTLSGGAAGTFSISPTTIAMGKSPDVAAIERTVSGMPHDVGLITYTSITDDSLYIKTWDVTAPSVSAHTVLDYATGGDNIQIPRIEADDNKALNAPAGATTSIYKVAAEVDSSTYKIIRTYDNLTNGTGSPHWTCSNVINLTPVSYGSPPYMHYTPTVAFCGLPPMGGGTTDATQYMVQHFTDEGTGAHDVVMMEPIDYTNPYNLVVVSAIRKYYWVSDAVGSTVSTSGVYANSVSSACNNVAMNSFSAWAYPDPTFGYNILYKPSPTPYAYKPVVNSNSAASGTWQVYPNPATDEVTITNPAGDGVKAGYEIVDMAGRTLLSGTFATDKQEINLATLPSGNYILQLHREDGAGKNQMFVKQ